jgi:hypothetical protein
MAHSVADGGNHLWHDTRSSASLKVPLLGGGTSIQTNEYSQFLNAFKNNLLPWFTNHVKKTLHASGARNDRPITSHNIPYSRLYRYIDGTIGTAAAAPTFVVDD